MRKLKILEKEKLQELYKNIIKDEEQQSNFKTKMIKLQGVLHKMFNSKEIEINELK